MKTMNQPIIAVAQTRGMKTRAKTPEPPTEEETSANYFDEGNTDTETEEDDELETNSEEETQEGTEIAHSCKLSI